MTKMTQMQLMYHEHRRITDRNEVMLDLLYGPNPITDDELLALVARDPARYGAYAGYLGKRQGA